MKKLNLGCGKDYKEDWVNLDCRNNVKLDVQHDLTKYPYPFPDNYFSEVLIKYVLEHLDNPIKVLKEAVRICKDKAKITLLVPHAYCYTNISDLQHKNNFNEHTFSNESLAEYELEELELKKQEFIFEYKWKKYIPFKKLFNGLFDNLKFEFIVEK